MYQTKAYVAKAAAAPLESTLIPRRDIGANDVQVDILYCGICHSDLYQIQDDWKSTKFPLVVGHEIVGRVAKVGASVTNFSAGDAVGIGCLVDSDRTCQDCKEGYEQFCPQQTIVFGSEDRHLGGRTMGGFSGSIVVDAHFLLRMPKDLALSTAVPLLCAGITVYSPLRHWKVSKDTRVGIVGLGGLGHLAVKFAKAMGAHITVLTTSPNKKDDALRLGADAVVVTTDKAAVQAAQGSLNFILDTVSGNHDVNALMGLLQRDGMVTLVGLPTKPIEVSAFNLIMGRRGLAGSNIGGIAETQEMLDFAAKHGIVAEVEVLAANKVNEALARLQKGDVRYRFCLDMADLTGEAAGSTSPASSVS